MAVPAPPRAQQLPPQEREGWCHCRVQLRMLSEQTCRPQQLAYVACCCRRSCVRVAAGWSCLPMRRWVLQAAGRRCPLMARWLVQLRAPSGAAAAAGAAQDPETLSMLSQAVSRLLQRIRRLALPLLLLLPREPCLLQLPLLLAPERLPAAQPAVGWRAAAAV